MVQVFPSNGCSNFTIETSYIDVTCHHIIHLLLYNSNNSNNSIIPLDTSEDVGFSSNLVNASQPFDPSWNAVLGSSFLDASSVNTDSLALRTPANLSYVSNAGISQQYKIPSTLYIYNCTVRNCKVEAKISCIRNSCTATTVRPSKDDADSPLKLPFFRIEYQNMLLVIPSSLESIPSTSCQYTVSKNHAVVLLIITITVLACAIADLILTLVVNAPDTLGYISMITNDNVHAQAPDDGNTLNGLERARYLSDVQVQVADINPADVVGHIALRVIDNAAEVQAGRLGKNILYP